jgi:hypothetical protein
MSYEFSQSIAGGVFAIIILGFALWASFPDLSEKQDPVKLPEYPWMHNPSDEDVFVAEEQVLKVVKAKTKKKRKKIKKKK